MQQRRHKRRIKLIKPRLQIRMVGIFLGMLALSLGLEYLVLANQLAALSNNMPSDGGYLMSELPTLLNRVLLLSIGLLMPMTFVVGVLVTFRIAGPVYRFEQYLGAVARGEKLPDCRLREGDQLKELCEIINEATRPLRADAEEADASAHETTEPAVEEQGGSPTSDDLRMAG